jgi:hypothetical protein
MDCTCIRRQRSAFFVLRHAVRLAATLLCASALAAPSAAQTPAARIVDSARVSYDRLAAFDDTVGLVRIETLLDRALQAFPGDPYLQHYRGLVGYRHGLVEMQSNPKRALTNLTIAAGMLSSADAKLPWPESAALLSSTYGLLIGLDQSRGMELGQQIAELQGRALSVGAKNPRVHLIIGQALANTPPEWGGGIDKARALITRAVELFTTDKPAPLAPTWGREEADVALARLGKGS